MEYKTRVLEAAEQYRKDGYDVALAPPDGELPSFLSAYQPDFIARKDNETVVVEVTTREDLTRQNDLGYVAAAVNARPGWRFDLVVVNGESWSDQVSPQSLERTAAEIGELSRETEQLVAQGQIEAAVLVGWAGVEATLRRLASDSSILLEHKDPPSVMKTLYVEGVLSHADFGHLKTWLRVRNSLAHGLKVGRLDTRLPEAMAEFIHRSLASREPVGASR